LDFKLPSSKLHRKNDNCVYGNPRKNYTRTHPPINYGNKIKWQKNEKVAIIKMRKLGYTINQLADFTGRSRSIVHKILKIATKRLCIVKKDYRKGLTNQARLRCSSIRRKMLTKFLPAWEAFILGETDKPP